MRGELLRSRLRICAGLSVVLVAGLIGPAAAGASVARGLTFTPPAPDAFDFGSVAAGQTSSQVFTLTSGRWDRFTGRLKISLSGSAAFSVTSDGCTGKFLTPWHPACQVTVQYAPAAGGQNDVATLSAAGMRWSWWHRWHRHGLNTGVTLTGTSTGASTGGTGGTGPASLQVTPGTLTSTSAGTNFYSYDFGQINTLAKTFTVKNAGGTASLPLALNGWAEGGYTLSNDSCSGQALAPNASCTFTETWSANSDPMCDAVGTPVGLDPAIGSADESTTYVQMALAAKCGR